jgi:hypothetical protein
MVLVTKLLTVECIEPKTIESKTSVLLHEDSAASLTSNTAYTAHEVQPVCVYQNQGHL